MIIGSSDKVRQDYAQSMANENSYNFIAIDGPDYKTFSKSYITSSLDGTKTLFYFYDIDKLSLEKCEDLLSLVSHSNHIFIFSLPTYPTSNYILTKNCISKNLGSKANGLSETLKILMTTPDRDSVRLAIADEDPIYLFHILKKNAWHSPETLTFLEEISRMLYKCKKSYITSLLAYGFPMKPYPTFESKKVKNTLVESLKSKIVKEFNTNPDETADIYLLCKSIGMSPVDLTDEEMQLFGFPMSPKEVKKVNSTKTLESFF